MFWYPSPSLGLDDRSFLPEGLDPDVDGIPLDWSDPFLQETWTFAKEPGADPGFFVGGGALVSCSSSTPINHIVLLFLFFLQNTSCIRKPQVISGRGAHPLHPPPRSAPQNYLLLAAYHGPLLYSDLGHLNIEAQKDGPIFSTCFWSIWWQRVS